MARQLFTQEELDELAHFDALVDEDQLTLAEWNESTQRDRQIKSGYKQTKGARYYANHREACLIRSTEWKLKNPDKYKRYQAKYRDDHRDERRAYDQVYNASHKEERITKSRERYAKEKTAINAKRKSKRDEDPEAAREKEREYRRAHADEINARRRRKYAEGKAKKNDGKGMGEPV